MRVFALVLRKAREYPMHRRTFLVLLPVLLFLTIGAVKIGGWTASQLVPPEELSQRTVSSMAVYQEKGLGGVVEGSMIRAPLREEVKYRLVPFYGLLGLWWLLFARSPGVGTLFLVGAATSAYFGFNHGGFGNILIQGVVGAVLWWILIVTSHMGRRPLTGFGCVVLFHALYNLGVFTLRLANSLFI